MPLALLPKDLRMACVGFSHHLSQILPKSVRRVGSEWRERWRLLIFFCLVFVCLLVFVILILPLALPVKDLKNQEKGAQKPIGKLAEGSECGCRTEMFRLHFVPLNMTGKILSFFLTRMFLSFWSCLLLSPMKNLKNIWGVSKNCFYFPLTFLRFFPGPSGGSGQNDGKGDVCLVFVCWFLFVGILVFVILNRQ